MQTEVLGNIPRLYTALADWLACFLYLFFLPKRTAGWRRYTIHAVFLLLLGVFMQATGQVPQFWFLPCIAVSILIMYLYIRMQADVPARCAGYYCVRAFIWGNWPPRWNGSSTTIWSGSMARRARVCVCAFWQSSMPQCMAWCSRWNAIITILPRLCTSTKRNFSARCSSVWRSMRQAI